MQSWWAEETSLKVWNDTMVQFQINFDWSILCAVFEQMHIQYVRRETLNIPCSLCVWQLLWETLWSDSAPVNKLWAGDPWSVISYVRSWMQFGPECVFLNSDSYYTTPKSSDWQRWRKPTRAPEDVINILLMPHNAEYLSDMRTWTYMPTLLFQSLTLELLFWMQHELSIASKPRSSYVSLERKKVPYSIIKIMLLNDSKLQLWKLRRPSFTRPHVVPTQ